VSKMILHPSYHRLPCFIVTGISVCLVLLLLVLSTSCLAMSENQAIAEAKRYVPQEVATSANIQSLIWKPSPWKKMWYVLFSDISVSKSELGWEEDEHTYFHESEDYKSLLFEINGITGEVNRREAYPHNQERLAIPY
jgi:hypothetical protein